MLKDRFSLLVTMLNLFVCASIIIWIGRETKPVQAQAPQAFIGPIYPGSAPVTSIFDHQYPLLSSAGGDDSCLDSSNQTMHNNGTAHDHEPEPDYGFGYDAHDGIDYDINYRPVQAGASGDVIYAGWSNPQNHEAGLGLMVKLDHPDYNNYKTIYGHMSVILVESGETTGSVIIGISGNTGSSSGSHLHFAVQNANYKPVNPYGWQGAAGGDPWQTWGHPGGNCAATYPTGATSHDLWALYPALQQLPNVPLQYPSGPVHHVGDWPPGSPTIVVDDSDASFSAGPDWANKLAEDGYLGNFHFAQAIMSGTDSPATWHFNISGSHSLFAHIPVPVDADPPPDVNPTHLAVYTIQHNEGTDQVLIAQSEYPNQVNEEGWAYLGNYFSGIQSVKISQLSEEHSLGRQIIADAVAIFDSTPVGCPLQLQSSGTISASWSVTGDGDGRIKVIWSGISESSLDYFNIYRNETNNASNWNLVHTEESESGQWVDTGVANGVTYYYWLEVFDCYGDVNLLGPKSTTTGVPAPPTDLGATYSFKGGIALSWQHTASDVTFNVYRSGSTPVPLDNSHRIANGLTTQFYSDPGGNMFHHYVVTAVKNNVESRPSNTAAVCSTRC